MLVIYSPDSLKYNVIGHPESSARVDLIFKRLKKDKKNKFVKPIRASEEDLSKVHTKSLIESVKNNTFSDPDTPNINDIFYYSSLSAGGAQMAADLAIKGKSAFSLMRPPGHHATREKVGGFCYFNNIAVAVAGLLHQGKKVAILDIDVHHGNGTEDIFLGKPQVLFCSLHQVPLYPGSGLLSRQNCYNFQVRPGCTFQEYKKLLLIALNEIERKKPDILAISLGFDTYKGDPLAQVNLEKNDYFQMGKMIGECNYPTFFVLEGGYSPDIGILAQNFFNGFRRL